MGIETLKLFYPFSSFAGRLRFRLHAKRRCSKPIDFRRPSDQALLGILRCNVLAHEGPFRQSLFQQQ